MIRPIIVAVIICTTLNAQTWKQVETQYNPEFLVDPQANGLFVDQQNGWCKNGYLYRTTDGGLKWQKVFSNNSEFTKVKFFDSKFGICSTKENAFKTTDGGDNWLTALNTPSWIIDIDFADSSKGVLCSFLSNYNSAIYYTIDGGNEWNKSQVPHPDSLEIWKIQLFESGIGWALGRFKGGIVMKTIDYGKTWVAKLEEKSIFYGGFFLNGDFGVAAGYITGESLYITHDGGTTWNPKFVSDYSFSKDVYFLNDSLGWCLASESIYETTDGGENWEYVLSANFLGFDAELQNIGFTKDNSFGYAFGSEGVLLVYDANPSSVEIDKEIPGEYYLSQNYPNPFNPSTIITYSIPMKSHVVLKVFDILGNEVSEVVNEIQSQGHYEVEFSSDDLPSGVYIYRLTADNYRASKKMLIIK
jgi:photosystem II stability/assembly factor-like uncharacterized protein